MTLHWKPYTLAGGAYLLLSLATWSGLWLANSSKVTTCGCGDAALYTWFLGWPAHAIAHGLNPIFSTQAGFPEGVNLLANTSVLALGLPATPITWLFGPVLTLNIGLTLAPVLSGLAMFALLRRWVTWDLAAFAGGLLYGFSPFVLDSLSQTWLHLAILAVPPMILACLDELLVTQRHRPARVGVALGLLLALQFFIGSEVLLLTVVVVAIGLVLLVGYAAAFEREALRRRARPAFVGLLVAGTLALALLLGPVLFALLGPAHFNGPIWGGGIYGGFRNARTTLRGFLLPYPASVESYLQGIWRTIGGYQGQVFSSQYLGPGLLVVLLGGLGLWWRDRRLWLFGLVGLSATLFSLGSSRSVLLPWRLLAGQPILYNVQPYRFVIFTYLAASVMLSLTIAHVHDAVEQRREHRAAGSPQAEAPAQPWWARRAPALAGLLVAAVALLPVAVILVPKLPMATRAVVVPRWFKAEAPKLGPRQVLLVLPATFQSPNTASSWQAMSGYGFTMVNQSGPAALYASVWKDVTAAYLISSVSGPKPVPLSVTDDGLRAVRRGLRHWGVTKVVLPSQPPSRPGYERVPSEPLAAALITAATGQRPSFESKAWVWTLRPGGYQHGPASAQRFNACTNGQGPAASGRTTMLANCLLGSEPSPG